MSEIDQLVVDVCIEYMPSINNHGKVYKDPRTQLIVGDAFSFVKDTDLKFDVVIIDSTDPIGPGEKLFSYEFYKNLVQTLNVNAVYQNKEVFPNSSLVKLGLHCTVSNMRD